MRKNHNDIELGIFERLSCYTEEARVGSRQCVASFKSFLCESRRFMRVKNMSCYRMDIGVTDGTYEGTSRITIKLIRNVVKTSFKVWKPKNF